MVIELIFSYGTLQDVNLQKTLFGKELTGKDAVLKGWSLFASDSDGYLFIKPDKKGRIKGKVLELAGSMIHTADQWEEIPFYKREKVKVDLKNNETCEAWVYTKREDLGKPYSMKNLSLNDPELVILEARSFINFKTFLNLPVHDRYILIPVEMENKRSNTPKKGDFFTEQLDRNRGNLNTDRTHLMEIPLVSEIIKDRRKISSNQRVKIYLSAKENSSVIIIQIPLCFMDLSDPEKIYFLSSDSEKLNTDHWLKVNGFVQRDAIRQIVFISDEEKELSEIENISIYRQSFRKTLEERLAEYAPLIVKNEENMF